MKPCICVIKIDRDSFKKLKEFMGIISESEKLRIMRFRDDLDKCRSLCGLLLGMTMLHNGKFPEIKRNKHNRPCVMNSEMDMNISHDGDYVVCAVDKKQVGIDVMDKKQIYHDIENKKKEEEQVFIRQLSLVLFKEELEFIGKDINRFCHVWTAKESYLKCMGTGFEDNVNVVYQDGKYTCENVGIYHFDIDEWHIVACTMKANLKQMCIDEFIEEINQKIM
eukprot:NODE_211_length_14581_cov_0.368941.p4 type:complete len:222 gc:universal NODE_211_length_14581_cov_0.368941:3512-2847(-)